VVRDRLVFWTVLAAHQRRTITADVSDEPLLVRVPASDLSAALDALVGNVFTHTPEAAAFDISCSAAADGGAVIAIVDTGPGLDEAAAGRGDSGAGSTGLGLDIARHTAASSGGELAIGRTPDGRNMVTLTLGPA
jgi:signal transduction histidine kinase